METMPSLFNSLTFVLILPVHLQRELVVVLTLQQSRLLSDLLGKLLQLIQPTTSQLRETEGTKFQR